MPGRNHIFEEGSYYHIYNRSIDGRRQFDSARNAKIFMNMMWYYRTTGLEMKHSRYVKLPIESQAAFVPLIRDSARHDVSVLAYCLMPTHYHILIQEKKKGGTSAYMSKVQNAFTRYYNIKLGRSGQLFRGRFKSKPITSEEMLMHVARYIHLNPYSSGLIKDISELITYPHSSMRELFARDGEGHTYISDSDLLISFFGDDPQRYVKFVCDNADYQKTLEYTKYLGK